MDLVEPRISHTDCYSSSCSTRPSESPSAASFSSKESKQFIFYKEATFETHVFRNQPSSKEKKENLPPNEAKNQKARLGSSSKNIKTLKKKELFASLEANNSQIGKLSTEISRLKYCISENDLLIGRLEEEIEILREEKEEYQRDQDNLLQKISLRQC